MSRMKEYVKSQFEGKVVIKRGDSSPKIIASEEKTLIEKKMNELFSAEEKGSCVILARGMKKKDIQKRLKKKLNADYSLYDRLFLIGDKAKNFLEKKENIQHAYEDINSDNQKVAEMIFDDYSDFGNKIIENNAFFADPSNRELFTKKIMDKQQLINYYLFGIHTYNSDRLVYFVSSTTAPEIAESKDKYKNDLILLFWLSDSYKEFSMWKEKLDSLKNSITELGLPILQDSCFPKEKEFSIKGFILPHFVIGVIDLEKKEFVINPAMVEQKQNWILEGFDIDNISFYKFIKDTKYKRFLSFYDGKFFETQNS